MKIKIHDGSPHEDGVVYLALREAEPDHIMLEVVGPNGEPLLDESRWALGAVILTITEDGHISRSPEVFPELGFQLNRDGMVELHPYGEAQTAKRARLAGGRLVEIK